jgi:hypothetical protein
MANAKPDGLMPPRPAKRLKIPGITICAVSSANVEATLEALETCLAYLDVAETLFFTDATFALGRVPPGIRIVPVDKITSAKAYSHIILRDVIEHVKTSHCLIVQWDGHVIDPALWRDEFLSYDYVGASWPQFDDGHDVGNGGFSLRSRRLMQVCSEPGFEPHHPEDVAICRTNRAFLESRGMLFAPKEMADCFAAERAGDPACSFGYHGVFLMPEVLGVERFWRVYRTLNDCSSMRRDYATLRKALGKGNNSTLRSVRLICNRLLDWIKRLL